MKSKIAPLIILLSFVLYISAACKRPKIADIQTENTNTIVVIKTDFGDLEVLLYDETPLHRDNFIKLIEEGFYEGLLFHRVIQNFMIQGGDPESRTSPEGQPLGTGGPDYTIPAEIHPHLIHKRGALAAARLGDNINPEMRSSGSQFYIVHGTILSEEQLKINAQRINNMKLQNLFFKFLEEEKNKAFKNNEPLDMNRINQIAHLKANEAFSAIEPFTFSEEHKITYMTTGGAPHLDGSYTVFGEVINGFEVIDKIAAQPVDNNNRPLTNIRIHIEIRNK